MVPLNFILFRPELESPASSSAKNTRTSLVWIDCSLLLMHRIHIQITIHHPLQVCFAILQHYYLFFNFFLQDKCLLMVNHLQRQVELMVKDKSGKLLLHSMLFLLFAFYAMMQKPRWWWGVFFSSKIFQRILLEGYQFKKETGKLILEIKKNTPPILQLQMSSFLSSKHFFFLISLIW